MLFPIFCAVSDFFLLVLGLRCDVSRPLFVGSLLFTAWLALFVATECASHHREPLYDDALHTRILPPHERL